MRGGVTRREWSRWLGTATLGVVAALAAAPVYGQLPAPEEPDITKRSGLLSRFNSIEPTLPPDPHRDKFYDTRFADKAATGKHPNWYRGGGLYGMPWRAADTKSIYPYFYGSPGEDSITANSRRWWRPLRFPQALLHPFKPVGMYYDQGSYVPVYDLDPICPGPGPYPVPWYLGGPHGG